MALGRSLDGKAQGHIQGKVKGGLGTPNPKQLIGGGGGEITVKVKDERGRTNKGQGQRSVRIHFKSKTI